MKTLIATSVLAALLASGVAVMAQGQNDDYLGLPGDNLNLYAVMNLFQESKTLEEFERSLNDENSRINNLDLNGDNLIDYINVFDNVNDNVHNIVLQVAVNKRERQDVAVFTVDRDRKGNVMIQLTGDEALYGQNYIIEPVFDDLNNNQTPNPGYTGNAASVNGREVVVIRTTPLEIAAWPIISYIYLPGYISWRSSWYWGYYPSYWNPWRPYYWHYYYGYHYNWYDDYYSHYRRWDHHRYNHWNDYYYRPHHSHSAYVHGNISNGYYKTTYSRPEERAKGEALYTSTHRDNPTRRTESMRVADQDRRTQSGDVMRKSSTGSASSSERRSTENVAKRSSGTSRPSGQVRSSEGSQSSKSQSAESRSSKVRTAESRSSSEARSSGNRSTQVRPAESKSRESNAKSAAPDRRMEQSQASKPRVSSNSKSSAPARKEAKVQASQSRSRESKSNSQARSKESSSRKESSRR